MKNPNLKAKHPISFGTKTHYGITIEKDFLTSFRVNFQTFFVQSIVDFFQKTVKELPLNINNGKVEFLRTASCPTS